MDGNSLLERAVKKVEDRIAIIELLKSLSKCTFIYRQLGYLKS